MTTQSIATRSGDQLVLHDEGTGPLVVLVSGLGGTARFWQAQRSQLDAAGYRVISFDQPGCGEAPPPVAPITIPALAQMLAEVLAAVAPGIRPHAIAGHSTGGIIVQEYLRAGRGPLPTRLILSGTWCQPCAYMRSLFDLRIRSLGSDFQGDFADYTALTWLLGVTPGDVTAAPARLPPGSSPLRAATQVARMQALLDFEGTGDAPRIALPTLILGAEDDRIVPVYHQRQLAGLVPGARLHILPDGGHFFPQSRPGQLAPVLSDWLAQA